MHAETDADQGIGMWPGSGDLCSVSALAPAGCKTLDKSLPSLSLRAFLFNFFFHLSRG